MNKQEDKLEERIRFVAKHYREGAMDTEKAWKRLASEKGIKRPVSFRRSILVAASIAVLFVGVGTLFFWKKNTPEWVIVSTIPGQLKDVYLPDSTLVSLSGNSEIRYDRKKYGKTGREVEMDGKAFYAVMRIESRPFSVKTNLAEVQVLGTSFQIKEEETSVKVDVETGKVSFNAGEENNKKNVILTAGMSAQYSMETNEITVLDEQDANYLSWKTGQLRFHNTPVEKVMEDLSDYYQVPVKSKTMIRGEKLTASFDNTPLEEVFMIIYQTLDIRLTTEESK